MYSVCADALISALVLSLIPMTAIALGAGLVALLQAVTQVQEQSFVHLARLAVIAACLFFGGQHAYAELERIFVAVVTYSGQRPER